MDSPPKSLLFAKAWPFTVVTDNRVQHVEPWYNALSMRTMRRTTALVARRAANCWRIERCLDF